MVEISKLSRLIDGANRSISLATNTIVVDNIKIRLGTTDAVTFAGTITDDRTITVPDADVDLGAMQSDIVNLVTLTGLVSGSTNLGTFTGSVISDNQYIKDAIQELETFVETNLVTQFSDASFAIFDDADNTKKIKFEASNISTLVSRTIVMPDADVDLGDMQADILALQGVTPVKERYLMGDLPTHVNYIDLGHLAIEPTLQVSVDRLLLHEDDDYTVSIVGGVTRLTWVGDVAIGGGQAFDLTDVVRVKYYYQA
jgi:hypothetical protein